ncbi:uncharacterized protein LACBIDRAFT_331730 [Laccaria bicolor S238N-H82]|uniref:Predicted protein n=1 Tax=Laccaria bicolor (strain S238N-H82 / ATCC MYA-4686) TaxID=486041 RepID=B0DQD4_LACBS|nr:uncharacterized protein LACBIDRAFT_331730 [Laccaria bicolor S238N-H82]EDR03362.1 predicted protein [Laccaria bicolor S238N-H82]|eukprot:XP_001886158.1 predicted protein [Laccaria bicolor S238N-H82]
MSTAELAQAAQQAHTLTPRFLEDVRVTDSLLPVTVPTPPLPVPTASSSLPAPTKPTHQAKSTDPVPAAETKSKSKTKSGQRKPEAGSSTQPRSKVTPNDTTAPVQSKKRKGDLIEARPKKTRVPHFSHMTPSAGLSLIQRPKLDPDAGPPKTAMAALRQAKTAKRLANQNAAIPKGNYQLTTIPCEACSKRMDRETVPCTIHRPPQQGSCFTCSTGKTTCTYAVTKKKDTDSEVEDEIQKGLQDLETATVSGGDAQVKIVRKKARSKKPQVKKVKQDVKEKGKQDVEMAAVGHDAEHAIDVDMEVGLTMGKGKSEGGINIEMAEVKHEETEVGAIPKANTLPSPGYSIWTGWNPYFPQTYLSPHHQFYRRI